MFGEKNKKIGQNGTVISAIAIKFTNNDTLDLVNYFRSNSREAIRFTSEEKNINKKNYCNS